MPLPLTAVPLLHGQQLPRLLAAVAGMQWNFLFLQSKLLTLGRRVSSLPHRVGPAATRLSRWLSFRAAKRAVKLFYFALLAKQFKTTLSNR